MCVCMYIYIYAYTYRPGERGRAARAARPLHLLLERDGGRQGLRAEQGGPLAQGLSLLITLVIATINNSTANNHANDNGISQ